MLRLLPERLYAGLFGHEAWLAQGAGGRLLPVPESLPASGTPAELLDVLLRSAPPRRRPGRLSVMLPSQLARCVSLPWSAALRSEEERNFYALAHLEQAGLGTNDSHAVHAEFRHYGGRGFAYAVPHLVLDELHAAAARHALTLTTVLPVGALAHLAARRARRAGLEVSLVVEDALVSMLAMDRTGLQRYDAEPAFGGSLAAMRRLMTRLAASGAELEGIALCTDRDEEGLTGLTAEFATQGPVRRLKTSQWRKYL